MVIIELELLDAATSIGGLMNKWVGHIGDTPLIGAGRNAKELVQLCNRKRQSNNTRDSSKRSGCNGGIQRLFSKGNC